MNDKIKKNLFDLDYNKYLQYFNTCIIIIFIYIIGLLVAIFIKQIDISKTNELLFLTFISLIFFLVILSVLLKLKYNLKNITEEIKKLNL
ncbi:hypothetical protein J4440_02110 [Candidatus Woesearchaeota archaeon]|nr:hypothetical protein [Candidatus Woesearchaeota archaeon]